MKKQLTIIFFMFPLFLNAQRVLSLEDCIRIGLEQNYDIRITRGNQKISDNNFTLGNAGYLPTLDLNSGYNIKVNNTQQYSAGGGEKMTVKGASTQGLDAGVNLNWTIFDGFSVQTNSKKLQELKRAGVLKTQLFIENFIAELTAEYYKYVQQNILTNNLRHTLDLSRERLRIVEARYQIGANSKLDLQQAKVDFNADSSKLIRQNQLLNASLMKLNKLMGAQQAEQYFLAAEKEIKINPLPSKEQLWQKTLETNLLLKLSEIEKDLVALDLKSVQSQNFPYLRLKAGYGFTQYDYNKGVVYDKQLNWGSSAGITLGYNIFDGFNRSREQTNAKIRSENKAFETERLKLSLQSNFANMWMSYQNNLDLMSLEKENLNTAKINYEIAIERYKLGELSGLELRGAQNSLVDAEERLATAQYNVKLYEISLLQISGHIMKRDI